MSDSFIKITGARTHNLKNISLSLPRNAFTVITGLSGSGKSSLAFDTLFSEGNRRYVESLSAYARQFLSMMDKADVDSIEGLSPAISIEQKTSMHNPRSTVGTITEIYDYLRLLYARVGTPHCPKHAISLDAKSIDQIVSELFELSINKVSLILAPLFINSKGTHAMEIDKLRKDGFNKIKINDTVHSIHSLPPINPKQKKSIYLVVDKILIDKGKRKRIADSLEIAIEKGDGIVVVEADGQSLNFSTKLSCPKCNFSLNKLEPRLFSFNSPMGACTKCSGLGFKNYIDPNKLIIHPDISLADGAIPSWNKSNPYLFSIITDLSRHYNFSLEQPIKNLSKEMVDILLYGTNKEKIPFRYVSARGRTTVRYRSFEGISKQLERRYRDTESELVREDILKYFSKDTCNGCNGTKLNPSARNVSIERLTLPDFVNLSIEEAMRLVAKIKLKGNKHDIAKPILHEIQQRLSFLVNVGLRYLTLNRNSNTLSGGESQRIRLASQIGAGLVGVMYVLDEPSIGLHQRDNIKLIEALKKLKNLGNTVIVVEHDKDTIMSADHVIDLGPGAGQHGGYLVAQGTPASIKRNAKSITGNYLSGKKSIAVPKKRTVIDKNKIMRISQATSNNLKGIDVDIPLGCFTCVTGVSGSGKSTLVNATLAPYIYHNLMRSHSNPKNCKSISNLTLIDKIIKIDQNPIGRTPRSNPATYIGLFTLIRELFASTPMAKAKGYHIGRFSFNVKGGRCEHCSGDGLIKVEMNFLADVYIACEVCGGKRFNQETLNITYRNKNIFDVLSMTVEQAYEFFTHHPKINNKLKTLVEVGLGYITLGQSSVTLSGGEAQRIKLSRELSKKGTRSTLYLLDEPTVGLHFHDVAKLINLIYRLREGGNTIVMIEHNLDIIKCADYIIDLGPEGGQDGGQVVATGTPEEISKNKKSQTGLFLKSVI